MTETSKQANKANNDEQEHLTETRTACDPREVEGMNPGFGRSNKRAIANSKRELASKRGEGFAVKIESGGRG